MGRRRAWNYHLPKANPDYPATSTRQFIPSCTDYGYNPDLRDDPEQVTCPACRKIIDKALLASRSADLPTVTLDKYEGPTPYRFTYKAIVGGQHVGFIVYDGAYGSGKWKVCVINVPEPPKDLRQVGYELSTEIEYASGRTHTKEIVFVTKEAALLACPALVESGKLHTLEKKAADLAAWRSRLATNEARILREDREELDALTRAIEALDSVRQREDLTNAEADGLFSARPHLVKAKNELAESLARRDAKSCAS